MTTTSLIVELLIIGFTFLFGVFLIFFSCTDICLGFLLTMDKWVTLIILIVIALAYSFGCAVNNATFCFTFKFFEKKTVRKIFNWEQKDTEGLIRDYREVHTHIMQNGSDALIQHIDGELAAIRISKCSILNFFLIAIGLLIFPSPIRMLGFFVLIVTGFFSYMWHQKNKQYFERMAVAYDLLGGSIPISKKERTEKAK